MTFKKCTPSPPHCGKKKLLSEFYSVANGRPSSCCIECYKKRQKKWDSTHKDRKAEHSKEWRKRNPFYKRKQ